MAAAATTVAEPNWYLGAGLAALGHIALGAVILGQQAEHVEPLPEPIMVVEIPAGAPQAAPQVITDQVQPEVFEPLPNVVTPPLDIPEVDAPLPPDPVTAPTPRIVRQVTPVPPQPRPVPRPAPSPVAVSPAATPGPAQADRGEGAGSNPRAQAAEADWYALISAHLERNKRYPREARRDGQEGTPVVRFTVNRRGRVTDISIRQSSGSEALDDAAMSLLRRVSPLPAMPRSMGRETVTITLPIEYTLGRK